jgi:glycosyltransferase involved in cell wall biosynthesis
MRIVHITYAWVSHYHSPDDWLKRIDFFTGILQEMSAHADIKSVHCINYEGILAQNNVEYHFLRSSRLRSLFPVHLHRYVKKLGADKVIVQGMSFQLPVILLRLALGHRVKIYVQHRAEKPFTGIRKLLQKVADRFITSYFFSSAELARPWITRNLIGDEKKITEVFGVPSVFSPMEKENARLKTRAQGTPVYLWVGDLDDNKNPLFLLQVFLKFLRLNPQASLYLIYKKTDLLEEMKKILRRQGAQRIYLVGAVERDGMADWYNSADFIISTSFSESSGAAVCEGMSCGCIPVLTRIPSFKMITNDGAIGLLFEAGNETDMLTALNTSTRLDISHEREKVLTQYQQLLSAQAIARKILHALMV